MKTFLLLELELVMDRFMNKYCEYEVWPDGYIYEELANEMAKAASIVFDANFKGQAFANESDIPD